MVMFDCHHNVKIIMHEPYQLHILFISILNDLKYLTKKTLTCKSSNYLPKKNAKHI